jgi:hypothetical protein
MDVSGQLQAPAALAREKSPCYPLDRRLGGSRAVLDAMVKRKISSPHREWKPASPILV